MFFSRMFIRLLLVFVLAVPGVYLANGCSNLVDSDSQILEDDKKSYPAEDSAGDELDEIIFSDFLDQIDSTDVEDRQALVDSFLAEIVASEDYGFPLVHDSLAVYLYTTDDNVVKVPGDHNGWNPDSDPMTNIEGTDLFYRQKIFPRDARLDYKFHSDGTWLLDPRNPRTVVGGYGPNSELVMPDFVDPPEILYYPEIEHGTIDQFTFTSEILGNTRTVRVYMPPDYDGNDNNFPSIYVHDGGEYISLADMDNVLDFCISEQICEPVIAVFVDPVNRNSEYWLNDDFRQMFIEELVPHIDDNYRTINDPERRAVMGASLGGITSVFLAHRHPDIFGMAGGHSSALWIEDEVLINEIEEAEATTNKYYLDVGTFEGNTFLNNNRRLRDIFISHGNEVLYQEWNDGHSWGNWRGHIDDILGFFFGAGINSVEE